MTNLTGVITARVSEATQKAMEALAHEEGVAVSEIVRRAVVGLVHGVLAITPAQLEPLERLRLDLGRVGGNLNQIARHLNGGRLESPERIEAALLAVQPEVRECLTTVRNLSHELTRRAR